MTPQSVPAEPLTVRQPAGRAHAAGKRGDAAEKSSQLGTTVRRLEKRLRAIEELSIRLNRIQSVEGIAEAIVAEVGAFARFDSVRVYAVDSDAGMCEPLAFRGRFLGSTNPPAEALRIAVGVGVTGWVAEHGEPLRIDDTSSEPRAMRVGEDIGPESLLLVPMIHDARVRGVIVLTRRGRNRFSEDDQSTVTVFAQHAAQALVNAEYYERVARQQGELAQQLVAMRRLLEVGERLLLSFDSGEVLESIADTLADVVRYDSLAIYRADLIHGKARAVVARDPYAEQILASEVGIGAGITGWALRHREAILVNDAHLDPRSEQIPGTPLVEESLIVAPLISDGVVLGTLNVSRVGDRREFAPLEFDLVKLFAGQASIALRAAETKEAADVRAEQDALTGLRHHGAFDGDLVRLIDTGSPFALLMLDLDGFKAFNDSFGHPAGDVLLSRSAAAMQSSVRDQDLVYRYGGDEFAIVLPGADRPAADEIAARVRESVERGSDTAGPGVGVSIGLASFPEDGATKEQIVSAADRMLYEEKRVREHDRLQAQLNAIAGNGEAAPSSRRDGVQARLAAAIEQSTDAVAITDVDGLIQYVNPAMEAATGLGRRDLVGTDARRLFRGDAIAGAIEELEHSTETTTWRGEVSRRTRDGSVRVAEATVTAVRDEADQLGAFVLVQRDVTHEREFEALAAKLARQRAVLVDRAVSDEIRMERVVGTRAFQTVFQPIVELETGHVVGYEALTRFDDGAAPSLRFDHAARLHFGVELEVATLRSALEKSEALPSDASLHLNVSAALFTSIEPLRTIVASARRPLVLEVAEYAAIDDVDRFRQVVKELGVPVRIAVEDGGDGIASLSDLIELAPAYVKLSRSLTAGIHRDSGKQAIVGGMLRFAAMASCKLIAEGVEHPEDADALRRLGVHLGQGYLLGRPEPIGAVAERERSGGCPSRGDTATRMRVLPPASRAHSRTRLRSGVVRAAIHS